MEFLKAEIKQIMEIKGTVFNVEIAKGGYTNEETGEISKPTYRLHFIAEYESEEVRKSFDYLIKVEDIENLADCKAKLDPLRFQIVEIKNVQFGKYQDKQGKWQDWYKCKFNDIKKIGK